MRAASGAAVAVHGDEALSYTVVVEADASWRSAPLHRFVRVHPVPDRGSLLAAIAPVSKHLAAIAVAGIEPDELGDTGASRICEPGSMQTPPLDWPHDNQPILLPLVRS
jgi:hypothetical protein